jgi:Trp operon repressor
MSTKVTNSEEPEDNFRYYHLTEENIKEMMNSHRKMVDLIERVLVMMFHSHHDLQTKLGVSIASLTEKEAAINKYQEELKILYRELADLRHN